MAGTAREWTGWSVKVAVATLGVAWVGGLGAAEAGAPLELRGIMQELGGQMEKVVGAIAREDFRAVEQGARAMAEHRQPPLEEKRRIVAYVGARMGQFKRLDDEVKRAADELAAAARRADGQGAIDAVQWLQSSCLGCHAEFRRGFVQHFYPTP